MRTIAASISGFHQNNNKSVATTFCGTDKISPASFRNALPRESSSSRRFWQQQRKQSQRQRCLLGYEAMPRDAALCFLHKPACVSLETRPVECRSERRGCHGCTDHGHDQEEHRQRGAWHHGQSEHDRGALIVVHKAFRTGIQAFLERGASTELGSGLSQLFVLLGESASLLSLGFHPLRLLTICGD